VPKQVIHLSLGRSLALAIEFQLGADMLGTALDPTLNDILVLAAGGVLRTVLNSSPAASCARPTSVSVLASRRPACNHDIRPGCTRRTSARHAPRLGYRDTRER
jgi:uncharacterized protein DUF1622